MNQNTCDLNRLLQQDQNANQFFCSLPEYVQETIRERGQNIHCADDLHRYAENLLECI